jgi:hypothetical protein
MTIQAHFTGDRVATVLKGTWHFGYGQKFDEKALKRFHRELLYRATQQPHFARTKDEVIIQIVGYGPSSTT